MGLGRTLGTGALLLGLLLHTLGCGSSTSLAPLPADGVVLAFGDSLTRGKGAAAENSYPSRLAALISRPVVNAGISGETSDRGLARLPRLLSSHQPNLVILMHGGNDILRNLDATRTKANLDAMITLCKAAGASVLLVGVPQKSLFSKSAPLYEQLATQHDLAFEPSIISTLLKQPTMKADMVHFNAEGYAKLAHRLRDVMAAEGAI